MHSHYHPQYPTFCRSDHTFSAVGELSGFLRIDGNTSQRVCRVAIKFAKDSTMSGRERAAPTAATAPVTRLADPSSAKSAAPSVSTAAIRPPDIRASDKPAKLHKIVPHWTRHLQAGGFENTYPRVEEGAETAFQHDVCVRRATSKTGANDGSYLPLQCLQL